MNKSIGQVAEPRAVVGVLDIYGFEQFKVRLASCCLHLRLLSSPSCFLPPRACPAQSTSSVRCLLPPGFYPGFAQSTVASHLWQRCSASDGTAACENAREQHQWGGRVPCLRCNSTSRACQ